MMEWDSLTTELQNRFTMDGKIPKYDWMAHGTGTGGIKYTTDMIDRAYNVAKRRQTKFRGSYTKTSEELFNCLDVHSIKGLGVGIIGSVTPWHEGVCLAWRGIPIVIEYNKIECTDRRLTTMTVDEWNRKPRKFDAVFSISSYEHDGLGRYGDPINPDGDLEAMANCRDNMLKDGGLLYLAVPMGGDAVFWNAHRRYGPTRWPLLIDGFELVYSPNVTNENGTRLEQALNNDYGDSHDYDQPCVVLRKK